MKHTFVAACALLLVAFCNGIGDFSPTARGAETAGNAYFQPPLPPPVLPEPAPGQTLEYIILTGGPSLEQWEKYKSAPHDRFWGSFVRASRTRIQQIQAQPGMKDNPGVLITWLVYMKGYQERGKQDKQDLVSNVTSVRDKYKIHMVTINNGRDVLNYLNSGQPRDHVKIASFEYFGHSNRCCFMFDYSSNIDSASKDFLHEDDLAALSRNLFLRNAFIKSWGCHTGESMSAKWRAATGMRMIGAIGRTDFSYREEASNGIIPVLSSPDGKWVQ